MLLRHKEIKQTTPTPTVGVTFVKSLKKIYHIDYFNDPLKKVVSDNNVWWNEKTINGLTVTEHKMSKWFERLKKQKRKQITQQMKVDYQNIRKIDLCYEEISKFCLEKKPNSMGDYLTKDSLNKVGFEVDDIVKEKCYSLLNKFNCDVVYEIDHPLHYFHNSGEI